MFSYFYSKSTPKELFDKGIQTLQQRYPKQTVDTWIKISAAVSPLFEEKEPTRPAVLLLLIPTDENVEFPRALASTINSCWPEVLPQDNFCEFEGKSFADVNITSIYEKLDNSFKTNHVALFHEISKIKTPNYLTIFHNICDNSFATYKRVCYILTVHVSNEQSQFLLQMSRQLEKEKNAILNQSWESVTPDSRAALIARVSPFTLCVLKEERAPLEFEIVRLEEVRRLEKLYENKSYWLLRRAENCFEYLVSFFISSGWQQLKSVVDGIKLDFPDVIKDEKSWETVFHAMEGIINPNFNKHPSVITFVYSADEKREFIDQFVLRLEKAMGMKTGTTLHLSADENQRTLFRPVKEHFQNNASDLPVKFYFKDVHKIKSPSVLTCLSAFCHEELPMSKDSYWIFSVYLPECKNSDNFKREVSDTLEETFAEVDEDLRLDFIEQILEYSIKI